jgi:hypothetical protein
MSYSLRAKWLPVWCFLVLVQLGPKDGRNEGQAKRNRAVEGNLEVDAEYELLKWPEQRGLPCCRASMLSHIL